MKKFTALLLILCMTIISFPYRVAEASSKPIMCKKVVAIRSSPSTSSEVYEFLKKGDVLIAVGSKNGYYKVAYKDGYGWTKKGAFITGEKLELYVMQHPNEFDKQMTVTKSTVVRQQPQSKSTPILSCDKGDVFKVKAVLADWLKVSFDGQVGYVAKRYCRLKTIVECKAFPKELLEGTLRQQIIQYALQFVGNPYVWGGNSLTSGVDCSGFTREVLKKFGINIKRCSYDQAEQGKRVPLDQLQPGDLIFYKRGSRIGHVVMYIGDGKVVQARGRAYGIVVTDLYYDTPAWACNVID